MIRARKCKHDCEEDANFVLPSSKASSVVLVVSNVNETLCRLYFKLSLQHRCFWLYYLHIPSQSGVT